MTTTTDATEEGTGLKARAFTGFLWAYGSFFGNRVLTFVATLVLARLLVPAQFGVVAFTLAVISYIENVADLGLGAALVQRQDADDETTIDTAFWAGLGTAVLLTSACWAAAPLIARAGPSAAVAPMFRVLSLQFLISALANPQEVLLMRHLRFRRLAVPVWVGATVKAAMSIILAAAGAGAWSLVWGQLAGTLAMSIVLWMLSSWRPTLRVSAERLRPMLKYGMGIALVGVLGEAVLNSDYIIIGAKLGSTALGFYLLAFRLPELIIASGFRVANTVFFPFYARLRDESAEAAAAAGAPDGERLVSDDLRHGYLETLRLGALIALPAGFVMATLARAIVLTLYGDRWAASAVPLGLIAIWAAFSALTSLPGALFKAIGRSWILTANAVVELAMILPALWFAADHGIRAVAAVHVGVKILYFCVLTVIVRRVLGVRVAETFGALLPGLLVGAATAAIVIVPAHALPPAVALLGGGSLAVVVYAVLLRVFAPDTFRGLTAPLLRRYGAWAKRPYARAAATRG